jgi:two-component system chemotaxis sensor kinase CheA
MSMDALTNAALDNLQKIALPKLMQILSTLHGQRQTDRSMVPEEKASLKEALDLLQLVLRWAEDQDSKVNPTELSPNDADMIADLEAFESASEVKSIQLGGNDEISPEDAAMMDAVDGVQNSENRLADSEGAEQNDIEIASGDDSLTSSDMSDEEARRLLADMDAPTTQTAQTSSDDTMSDDEARKLLADMDAPATSEGSVSTEMSDEEARRLLTDMDTPAQDPVIAMPTVAPRPQQINIVSKPAPSADDEALALLAAMGGLDESTSKSATHPTSSTVLQAKSSPSIPAPVPKHEDETPAHDDIGEISEWESNDFASDPEMMNDFTTNSADIMQNLDDTVLRLEQDPTNKETIEEIFRAAHTLKGAAGMFGFRAIERVMHRMENLFDNVRKGKLVPNADTIDAVFQGLDCLKKLLAAVLAQRPSGIKTAPIVRMLELASAGKPTGASRAGASATSQPQIAATAAPAPSDDHSSNVPQVGHAPGGGGSKKKSEAASTIRVDLERLDALVNLIGELVIDRTRFVNIDESLRIQAPHLKLAGSMTETLQQFGRHMNEIQDIIMKVRMVPVGSVFNKYPRIVRDLARQLGKQIDLVVEGEETEFDKTLVEQIADPLVHLIRNACDHGVETPDIRQASGKSPNGTVTLSARQEGNHIIIQITDDGKGMDVARIKAKGIEKGLITADQTLTDRDIFNLIFEPGFSTAEKVTTVSGRGVGMDVVKKQIAKLKGMVEITSAPGKGSTITIQLPLTLAIMQSLLVGIQEEVLAIPLSSVVESIRIKPSEIQKVGDSEVIKLRNTVLPLMYLDEVLGLESKNRNYWYRHHDQASIQSVVQKRRQKRSERMYVVVVGTAERRYGLVVDALLNQQEMVIKPLGPLMRGTPCVAGGAVLGNGEVVLVMDIPEIETYYRSKKRTHAAA